MTTKKTAKKTISTPPAAAASEASPVAKKAPAKKVAAKKAGTPKVAATPTATTAAEPLVAKAAVKKAAVKHSPDELARAAYLNYRRRVEQGLPGDSHGDWLEAERYFARKHEA